jgi:hypothetical protein
MKQTKCQTTLPFHPDRKLTVDFEGGRVSSDAGLMLLYAVDRRQGLSQDFAAGLRDERDERYVRHSIETLTAQRMLQIVAGYEDGNDADHLRSDAALKSFCDRLPETGPELASGATLCRLENSVDWRSIFRISRGWVRRYAQRLRRSGRRRVVLDLDSTDDPTHGQQEFSFYHGYFKRHIYHPLLVFDAETGDLLAAVLRGGNRGAAARAGSVLRRIVTILRQVAGPDLEIEIRGDCGFATPELYTYCEQEGLDYTIGFSRNRRLEAAVEEQVEQAQQDFEREGIKQRQFTEFLYRADSWDRERRMVAKVEMDEPGLNRRFVVTNRHDLNAEALYDHYIQRGQSENYIKALKNALAADRLSCHRFLANQFRLLLHGLAYQLLLAFRRYLAGTPWDKMEIETLRRRVFKVGARIRETTRRIWIHCSSAYPEQETFFLVLQRICGPPG